MRMPLLFASFLSLVLAAGCADDGRNGDPSSDGNPTAEGELRQRETLDDNALKGKLAGILRDVTFTSESDYGYVVLEGESADGARMSNALIRAKLRAAIQEKSSDHRDIQPNSVRAVRLNVSHAINDGNQAVPPGDPDDDSYAQHDRQLSIALKVMRSQLKSVVGYTFGTNESGDGDGEGNVLYVYTGISKTSGKLIAIMTEAVYT